MSKRLNTNNLRATVVDDPVNEGLTTGDDALVLVDGSETPLTAHGHSLYTPHIGDRLLLNKVDSRVEIVQTLDLGATPYAERWASSDQTVGVYTPGWSVIDFDAASDDTQGITWDDSIPDYPHFTIERAGTYAVVGQLSAEPYDTIDRLRMGLFVGGSMGEPSIDPEEPMPGFMVLTDYLWRLPNVDNGENEQVTFTMVKRLVVGDWVWAGAHDLAGGDLVRQVNGGRSQTRITISHLSD